MKDRKEKEEVLILWLKQREAQNTAPGNKKWGRVGGRWWPLGGDVLIAMSR